MVEDYARQFYLPNINKWRILKENDWNELKALTLWKQNVTKLWPKIRIIDVQIPIDESTKVGDRLPIQAVIDLAGLGPDEIRVEAYIGRLDERGEIPQGYPLPLLFSEDVKGSAHVFKGNLLCLSSGQIGFGVRCYPYKKELGHKFELGLLTWW